MNVRARVESLIGKYRTRDPFEMIQEMNATLVYYPLEDGVRGFYQYFKRNHIIYIDERLSRHDQTFVLAHEIGHMTMHRAANAIFMDTRTQFNTQKYEMQADKFAIELLIPSEIILENWQLSIEQLSRLTGYSEELIRLRLQ